VELRPVLYSLPNQHSSSGIRSQFLYSPEKCHYPTSHYIIFRRQPRGYSSFKISAAFGCVMGKCTANKHSKGKCFPYLLPSVERGADTGVQAVSTQVTISHPPNGRLPLLSARPAVTFPAAEYHHPLAGTKLYCLGKEAHRCEQLSQGFLCSFCPQVGFDLIYD